MYVDTLLTQEKGVTLLRIRIILITFVLNLHIIMNVNIEQSWKDHLGEEFEKQYFVDLTEFVRSEYLRTTCYPPGKLIFNAFNLCPFDKVKVVIIGQDPYHEPGQAHGMCFSVQRGVKIPPSLVNIYQELHDDCGCYIPNNGYLEKWARQGVLLLNTVLTVRGGMPGSHQNKGWEKFTDAIIRKINEKDSPVVYMLWGKPAQSKMHMLNNDKHLILTAPHPSPLSAYRGFFGCRHFSRANQFLEDKGLTPIDWQIENI